MTAPQPRPRLPKQPRQLDAGPLETLIGSFALHLAAEGKAARTVQGYTSAVEGSKPRTARSAIRRPAASTATCGPAPGTPRPTGLSCGSA